MFSQMHADQSIKLSAKPVFLLASTASRYKACSMWVGVEFQRDVVNDNSSLIAKGQNSQFSSTADGPEANQQSICFFWKL